MCKKKREWGRTTYIHTHTHTHRNDVGQMIKELNHTIEKGGKTRKEKHTENERKRNKNHLVWQ
jgi:5-methylcytosine-specific restriction endonuclease McrBC regulatory subunit McrC